jgi:hypothetical protein
MSASLESLAAALQKKSSWWTVERRRRYTYPAHANKMVRNNKLQKFDSTQSWPRTNWAAWALHYRWLHLWMLGGTIDARGHYRWLRLWMPQRKGNKTIWSKTTCMNHEMGLKFTLKISNGIENYIENFKATMLTLSWASIGNKLKSWWSAWLCPRKQNVWSTRQIL